MQIASFKDIKRFVLFENPKLITIQSLKDVQKIPLDQEVLLIVSPDVSLNDLPKSPNYYIVVAKFPQQFKKELENAKKGKFSPGFPTYRNAYSFDH